MGYIVMNMREDDAMRFDSALKKAKSGIHEACEIYEDMKQQFGERGGYGERYDGRYSNRGGEYGERDFRPTPDWEMRRDSRGRYM